MDFFLIFVTNLLIVFGIITIHEMGHYLAGLTAGIPQREMKVHLFTFPQHVALRDGDSWVSPVDTERYVRISRLHLSTRAAAFRYVAGGLVVETIFTTIFCITSHHLGWNFIAFWAAVLSLAIYAINLFLFFVVGAISFFVKDIPLALSRRLPYGDISGLWDIYRLPAVLLVVAGLIIRILLVWHVS